MPEYVHWPTLAPEQFLPIFTYAVLVIVLGAAYAALITLGKIGIHRFWSYVVGYLVWGALGWSLYALSELIQSNPFTVKVLVMTWIAYLFVPHLYFYLIHESETRYDTEEEGV